jgi:hypothetical protein
MANKREFDWGAITGKIKEADSKKSFSNNDENEYKIKTGTDGTAQALIRFLPPPINEMLPFVKLYKHGFQDQGGWFIHNCPTTINKPCPVCKENGKVWAENEEEMARKIVGNKGRNLNFYSNILVVNDPQNPENNGKVFKFRYGKKIHDKIIAKLNPTSEFDEMVPIHDYEKGANFKLEVKKVKGYNNYDSSAFLTPSPIGDKNGAYTQEQIDDIDSQLYPLEHMAKPEEFKSYEFLAIEYSKKTGVIISTSEDGVVNTNVQQEQKVQQPKEELSIEEETIEDNSSSDGLDDDADAFFANLRN